MINRRNNNRRSNFRPNNRNFRSNGSNISDLGSRNNFQNRNFNRNNHNAPKLMEKYNNLAREALSNGDKILSENYYQHADHFRRISLEKSTLKNNQEVKPNNTNINDSAVNEAAKEDNLKQDETLDKISISKDI